MLAEVNEAKEFLINKFGDASKVPAGKYAIPTSTSKGDAFMGVTVTDTGGLSGFELWWDEAMTLSWYDFNKDGTKK